MDGGSLTGTIPTGFATCFPGLWELDLSYNNLTGEAGPACWQALWAATVGCPCRLPATAALHCRVTTRREPPSERQELPPSWHAGNSAIDPRGGCFPARGMPRCTRHLLIARSLGASERVAPGASAPAGTVPPEIAQVKTLEEFKVRSLLVCWRSASPRRTEAPSKPHLHAGPTGHSAGPFSACVGCRPRRAQEPWRIP